MGTIKRGAALLLCTAVMLRVHSGPADNHFWVGDAPSSALPLATDLSPKLTHVDVSHAIQKVAGWQLYRAEAGFDQDWTFATLYTGFMAVPEASGGQQYREAMLRMGRRFDWQPGPILALANDQGIGQTYLDLYRQFHDPAMIDPIRERMDAAIQLPDPTDPQMPLWWWCDALFMAPPVLARLSSITGDQKYLDFMDREWWITSSLLYSSKDHLFFRDATYLQKRERNGRNLFWSRGNGWVMGGLVRVLREMPANYPTRPKYLAQFREMAEQIASLQGKDGLWRAGLLDADAYKLPENSGSAFFVYALAYGVNAGILDPKQYRPVIEKGWAGLLSHIYQDGRLGCIQPIGAAPDDFTPTSSYVFGTGAFLLAGSEVYRLAD